MEELVDLISVQSISIWSSVYWKFVKLGCGTVIYLLRYCFLNDSKIRFGYLEKWFSFDIYLICLPECRVMNQNTLRTFHLKSVPGFVDHGRTCGFTSVQSISKWLCVYLQVYENWLWTFTYVYWYIFWWQFKNMVLMSRKMLFFWKLFNLSSWMLMLTI